MSHTAPVAVLRLNARACRLKELEASDPAYLAAVREYKRRMASKDNTELEPLLLRINSAHAVRASLPPLAADAQRRYTQLLRTHGMQEALHAEALEGALRAAEQVRRPALTVASLQHV